MHPRHPKGEEPNHQWIVIAVDMLVYPRRTRLTPIDKKTGPKRGRGSGQDIEQKIGQVAMIGKEWLGSSWWGMTYVSERVGPAFINFSNRSHVRMAYDSLSVSHPWVLLYSSSGFHLSEGEVKHMRHSVVRSHLRSPHVVHSARDTGPHRHRPFLNLAKGRDGSEDV